MPFFSVVLATRDRPGAFAEALDSILAQDHGDFEVVVVDDGSSEEHRRRYEPTLAVARDRLGDRLQVHRLVSRLKGHGPSYGRDFGVAHATGAYICFLDDDDCWTDAGHLTRAARAVGGGDAPVDLYMANQVACRDGVPVPGGPAWIGRLAGLLAGRGVEPRADGSLPVAVDDLMALGTFCHLNALIVRRALYEEVGGMDESIRWEEDRDLFLRLVDRAGTILHNPAVVARHNVPDPARAASASTSLVALDRLLHQLRVLDKASLFARHPAIRAHGRRHKAHALKRIAEELHAASRWGAAAYYAREALGAGPTLKWCAFALYCNVMALSRREAAAVPDPA